MYQNHKIIQLKKCIIVNKDDDIEYIIIYDFTGLGNIMDIMDIMRFQSILKSKKIGIFSFLDSFKISRNWTSNEKFKFNLLCHLTEFLKHYDLNKTLNELKYLDKENEPNEIEFMMKSLLENRYKRLSEIFNCNDHINFIDIKTE